MFNSTRISLGIEGVLRSSAACAGLVLWRRLGHLIPLGPEIPDMRLEPSRLRPRPPALYTKRDAGNDETRTECSQDESSERDAVDIPD